LVFGILGLTCCFLFSIAAICKANEARNAIAATPGMYAGEGMATAGKILGIVGLVLAAIGVVINLISLIFTGALSFS